MEIVTKKRRIPAFPSSDKKIKGCFVFFGDGDQEYGARV
jgi:hypothetical protein